MKRINLVLIAVLLSTIATGQQIIRVRSQHSKKLIRTLRNGEFLMRGESRIQVSIKGEEFEYLTTFDGKQHHYKNDQLIGSGIYASRFWQVNISRFTERIDGSYLTSAIVNNHKIGPYEELVIDPFFNREKNELSGYYYKHEGSYYIKNAKTGKTIGPYEAVRVQTISSTGMYYTYQIGGKWFLHDFGKEYGPYLEVELRYSSTSPEGLTYSYKDLDGWKIQSREAIPHTFVSKPELRFDEQKQWLVYGTLKGDNGIPQLFFQNGNHFEHTEKSQTLLCGNLPVLVATKTLAGASSQNQSIGLGNRFNYYDWYELRLANEVIDTFQIERVYADNSYQASQFYPIILYKKANGSTKGNRDEFYLYKNGQGLVGPISSKNRNSLSVGGDSYAFIDSKDKTLYMNGIPTGDKEVSLIDLTEYPTNWWMAKKEGDYTVIYKNGKVDKSKRLQEKYPYMRFDTRDKPYIIVQSDNKSYAKTPTSSKLFGPVSPRSIIAFSAGNSHYAEGDERAAQILIDGKVISTGYSLVYNRDKNTYHWISQEGQRLFFHTYELD